MLFLKFLTVYVVFFASERKKSYCSQILILNIFYLRKCVNVKCTRRSESDTRRKKSMIACLHVSPRSCIHALF